MTVFFSLLLGAGAISLAFGLATYLTGARDANRACVLIGAVCSIVAVLGLRA